MWESNPTHLKHSTIAFDLGHQINRDTVYSHKDMGERVIQQAEVMLDEHG